MGLRLSLGETKRSVRCTFLDEEERVVLSLGPTDDPRWDELELRLSKASNPFARRLRINIEDSGIIIATGEVAGAPLIYVHHHQEEKEIPLDRFDAAARYDEPLLEDDTRWTAVLKLRQTVGRQHRAVFSGESSQTTVYSMLRVGADGTVDKAAEEVSVETGILVTAHRQKMASFVDGKMFAPFDDLPPIRVGAEVVGPLGGPRFAVVAETSESTVDLGFGKDVSTTLETAIRFVRQRDLREHIRHHTSQVIAALCEEHSSSSSSETTLVATLDEALRLAEPCLPGCSIWIGLLQPGGNELRYVAASRRSGMKGQRLRRGEGVSFQNCIDPGCFSTTEEASSEICFFSGASLPYFAWPLATEDTDVLGLLGVDSTDHVAGEKKPEPGIMEFLRDLSTTLATLVQTKRHAGVMAERPFENDLRLLRWTLETSCEIALRLKLAEIWTLNAESRTMRVVARLTPGDASHIMDAPVLVAADPNAVRQRADRDNLAMPDFIARADHLDDLARRHYVLNEASAIVTEISAGQIINAALYNVPRITRIDDGPRRYVLPLSGTLLLVLSGDVASPDLNFIANHVAHHFRNSFRHDLPLSSSASSSAPCPAATASPGPSPSSDIPEAVPPSPQAL